MKQDKNDLMDLGSVMGETTNYQFVVLRHSNSISIND